jgi:4-amino-4-deoxychorismate lyase
MDEALFGIWVDGEPCRTLAAADRGLMYGDGIFRTMVMRGGRIVAWPRHYRRLAEDCGRLAIVPPPLAILERDLAAVAAQGKDCVVKIVVTRGVGGRGYRPPAAPRPTRLVVAAPLPEYPAAYGEAGVRLHLCTLRLAAQPRLAGVKHLNRLENVLARMEWSDPDIPEGLLRDTEERVIEGTMSNLFMRRGRRLITPDLSRCGVAGVQRERILELAPRLGLRVEVGSFAVDELLAAEEVFVCNSVIGLWPVRSLEARQWPKAEVVPELRALLESSDV